MTTIVLVTIGIILAAAAALMTVWYGGNAFDQGRINAEASRLLVEGSQIERAEGLYRAQEGRTADVGNASDPLQALIDRRYLAHPPSGDNGRWFVDYQNGMIRADVGSSTDTRALQICRAARRTQKLPDPGNVFRCDGTDYPGVHPAGTLPANEPCCTWTGATSADAGGGRGESGGGSSGGGSSGGGSSGGGADDGYDPVGSSNSYTCEQRVDFLRRSFDAIQSGTRAFYAKYGQYSTIEQMIQYGFVPAWARTAGSGDYSPPTIETSFTHTPWPSDSNKPYINVNLTDDMFGCFASTWQRKYSAQSIPGNYYGNHIAERIVLISGHDLDATDIVTALSTTYDDLTRYVSEYGILPGRPLQIVDAGYEPRMPYAPQGQVGADYIFIARSQDDYNQTANKRAIHLGGLTDDMCVAVNKANGGPTGVIPVWPSADRGCFFYEGTKTNEAYAYVYALDNSAVWSPDKEFFTSNPSAHFVFTTSKPELLPPSGGDAIVARGYVYWGHYLRGNRYSMHPGISAGETTSLLFKAPEAGSYFLRGAFQPQGGCGDGVMTSITGLPDVVSYDVRPRSFSFHRTLSAGATVEFKIDMRGTPSCDTTWLNLAVGKD